MSDKKTIAVVGATGAQGGGLARSILDEPDGAFQVRALTRKPESDAARALADRGAQVVQADLDDVESLRRAFDGCWGAYCVTNFWEHFSPEKEIEQARHMVSAAGDTGLRHVVWSTLDDSRDQVPLDDDRMPTLQGKYKVPHYDGKGEANAIWRQSEVPTTLYFTSFYWENMIHFGMGPQRGEDGTLNLVFPLGDAKLPGMAVEDIGRCAHGIFREGAELVGQDIGVAGEHLSGDEMAAALTDALGETVKYQPVSPEVYRSFDFPGADDLGNMFQWQRDFEDVYRASRSVEMAQRLNPELQSFRDWLADNAQRIPVE